VLPTVVFIAGVLLAFSGLFATAAASSFKRRLEWPDYAVLIVPLVALESIIAAFAFLSLYVAIILSIVLVVAVLWSITALLKASRKKRVATH
jgi:hypothetical protein